MWLKDSIGYQIITDRFAGYDPSRDWNKEEFIGGNFNGITGKLPYLADLGINTLWISPVFKTTAFHGYNITDYYATDERFGTEQELANLISQAHRQNIRIIIDFVPNHCSREHPIFQEAMRNKKSPYRSWFYFNPFNNKYLCFLHFTDLPKLNLENRATRNYITDAAKHWISLGIDGFRLDHSIGPSHRFWKYFSKELKSANPETVLVGEAWLENISSSALRTIRIRRKFIRWLHNPDPWDVELEYTDVFDGSLDFLFCHLATRLIAWKDNPEQNEELVRNGMNRLYQKLPAQYFLPSFIENHDMNRFLFSAGQDMNKLKMALRLQFSLSQPPILYYGTETGMTHDRPVSQKIPLSDLQVRKPMPWDALDYEMIDFCRELIRKRKNHFNSPLS